MIKQNITHNDIALTILDNFNHPVIMVDKYSMISYANVEAELFFKTSASTLARSPIQHFLPFDSPFLSLIARVRDTAKAMNEYRIDLSSPRIGKDKLVDIFAKPLNDVEGAVVVVFQEKSMAEKINRQMTHRGAARSVSSLASMLAHEIKNPLSGIRGAAQLLESVVDEDDRELTRLITDETDRIVALVDRMEVFSDERPIERVPVNIHTVLNRVKTIALNGFAKNIKFIENYDPSLPPVYANRDQLIQIFLNLVKNAAEALEGKKNPIITLTTAFRPGIRFSIQGSEEKVALPMEFCVEDNGKGVGIDFQENLFDPFVTSKINGSGLGLALVAKLVNDHGGIVECDSTVGKTIFRVLLPMWRPKIEVSGDQNA